MTHIVIAGLRAPARRATRLAFLSVALLLPFIACDPQEILKVEDPDILTPGSLIDANALPTLRRAALGEFSISYSGSGADGSGGTEGVIMYSGLLGDEWINSETFPTRIEVDRRNIVVTNATVTNWFRNLHRARVRADFAAEAYADLAPDLTVEVGYPEVLALAGFTHLFSAENWCSGVPFSKSGPDGSFEFGQPLTTTQMLDSALARFNDALAAASALDDAVVDLALKNDLINLARVGRGRALLDKGDFPGAAAAVTLVPDEFVYLITHSENSQRQNNGVFFANVLAERYSVADREAGVGLPYRSENDPRVAFRRTVGADGTPDVGFDRATPQYDQRRYLSRTDPIPLATGLEARLVEAEAALALGASSAYLTILNTLRGSPPDYILANGAAVPPMGTLSDPGTASGRVDQFFQERAFWLWLTGHRLSDMRRLMRQYGRPENTVFPTGAYFKQNLQYDGTDVHFPVPFDEENNPSFSGCLDRNP